MRVPINSNHLRRITLACPWLKRVGYWGFLFFLVKGLLWLVIPAVLVYIGTAD